MVIRTLITQSLLDPAYSEIGPDTCVGMKSGWSEYSWVPAIVLTSVMIIFVMDLAAERYVESKYGLPHGHVDVQGIVTNDGAHRSHQYLHTADQRDNLDVLVQQAQNSTRPKDSDNEKVMEAKVLELAEERSFQTQIAAFLILEFGVIFHSVIIGLNLGTAGDEFSTLYPVLVFHQSFEGLGIGARMSAIAFPRKWRWLPWALCTAYGLTTPIAIAIGLGVRTSYNGYVRTHTPISTTKFPQRICNREYCLRRPRLHLGRDLDLHSQCRRKGTPRLLLCLVNLISRPLTRIQGLVELLARDFLFDPDRTRDNKRLTFMVVCVFLGAGLMALLGEWLCLCSTNAPADVSKASGPSRVDLSV